MKRVKGGRTHERTSNNESTLYKDLFFNSATKLISSKLSSLPFLLMLQHVVWFVSRRHSWVSVSTVHGMYPRSWGSLPAPRDWTPTSPVSSFDETWVVKAGGRARHTARSPSMTEGGRWELISHCILDWSQCWVLGIANSRLRKPNFNSSLHGALSKGHRHLGRPALS